MAMRQPTVSMTPEALVIRIPWQAVELGRRYTARAPRHVTREDVLQIVEAGRLAHRVGKSRSVKSLRELVR